MGTIYKKYGEKFFIKLMKMTGFRGKAQTRDKRMTKCNVAKIIRG